MDQLFNGAKRLRVGIKPEGRAPAREGTEIVDATGAVVGRVTSGGFGPSVNGPVAMGYVRPDLAERRHRARPHGARPKTPGARRAAALHSPNASTNPENRP